jgi:hypothetical protein
MSLDANSSDELRPQLGQVVRELSPTIHLQVFDRKVHRRLENTHHLLIRFSFIVTVCFFVIGCL